MLNQKISPFNILHHPPIGPIVANGLLNFDGIVYLERNESE